MPSGDRALPRAEPVLREVHRVIRAGVRPELGLQEQLCRRDRLYHCPLSAHRAAEAAAGGR